MLWLMALLLVAQVLLPIQSHTRWVVAEDGQVIELCTLHGAVTVTLEREADTTLPDSDLDENERTAAMTFSQLLAEALAGGTHIQLAWLALSTVDTPPAVIGTPSQRPLRLTSIRAPPVLV